MLHLLKWDHQPDQRSRSWTADRPRAAATRVATAAKNPGLKSRLDEALQEAYADARDEASGETGLPASLFPAERPYEYRRAHGAADRLARETRPKKIAVDMSRSRRPESRSASSRSPAACAAARPTRPPSRRWRGSRPTAFACSFTAISPRCRPSTPTTTRRATRRPSRSRACANSPARATPSSSRRRNTPTGSRARSRMRSTGWSAPKPSRASRSR